MAPDGTKLLRLTYGETAKIWRINRGLRRNTQERGFKLDVTSGVWGDARNEQALDNLQTEVNLMVDDTCNVLVVEPINIPTENPEAFLATFQYALERAIQAVYRLEEDELASSRLGQGQNLLFWESAEGEQVFFPKSSKTLKPSGGLLTLPWVSVTSSNKKRIAVPKPAMNACYPTATSLTIPF